MKTLRLSIIAIVCVTAVILFLIAEPDFFQKPEIQKNTNVTLVLPQNPSATSLSKSIPDEIKVVIGQNNTIVWKNNDIISHYIEIGGQRFPQSLLQIDTNSSFSYQFDKVDVIKYGIYADKSYHNILFQGTIIIEDLNQTSKSQRVSIIWDPVTQQDLIDNPKQVKMSDLTPNSSLIFVYPYTGNATVDLEAFHRWILIRLPTHDGGDKDDVSSFRAYSMVDIQLNCVIKYWPQREWLEDPCHGSLYEPVYGIPFAGPAINYWIKNAALPQLDLGVDNQGYIYVKPPVFDIDKNGLVGYGRKVPADLFEKYGQIGQSHLQQVIRQNE